MGQIKIKIPISLTDLDYFCNKSWTVSYNFNTKSWISFHSYLPNWYIAENNFFYSGVTECCNDFDFIVGTLVDEDCKLQGGTAIIDYEKSAIIPRDCTLLGGFANVQTTTTTSTTIAPDCDLDDATAYIEVEPPCRDEGLNQYEFIYGYYTITTDTTVDSSTSWEDACDAIDYINGLSTFIDTELLIIDVETAVLDSGYPVYLGHGGEDCDGLIPDGVYVTQSA